MAPLREAIAALLRDPLDVVLARSILGTDDAAEIAERVEAFVGEAMGRAIAGCSTFTQSVGAVFVVELDDGARVVVKAHAIGGARLREPASIEALAAVYAAQEAMAGAGFPCARVLAPPRAWPGGAAAVMAHLDAPAADDPH